MRATLIRLTTKPEVDGLVEVTNHFNGLDPMARVDLLQDWINMLQALYEYEIDGKKPKDVIWNDVKDYGPEKLYCEQFQRKAPTT